MTTLAAMMAAAMALCGVAQAKPTIGGNKANAQCKAEAVRTLQPGFKPSDYTFVGGTEGDDNFDLRGTEGPDVFCGFDGNNLITVREPGDIFLGGAGIDVVGFNRGTFFGEEGNDRVADNYGTFNGGDGIDTFETNNGTFVQ